MAQLERRGSRLAPEAPPDLGPVHQVTGEVLAELVGMAGTMTANKGVEIPAWLRAGMETFRRMQPKMMAELAQVPPEAIQEFMRGIRDKINRIVDAEPAPARLVEVPSGPAGPDDAGDAAPREPGGHIASSA